MKPSYNVKNVGSDYNWGKNLQVYLWEANLE